MKPVVVVRHSPTEGPGHLATHLERRGVPWRLVALDAGEPLPVSAAEVSGLAFMGGPMSVNDPLPWIEPALALIRGAVAAGVPVIGHCLGGQLMSRALGGSVGPNPVREIGWGAVTVRDHPLAQSWFGEGTRAFEAFHWHGETFTLPAGAVHLLESRWCGQQGFALGPHLGLQCHVEMTATLVADWCRDGAGEIAAHPGPSVQSPEDIQAGLEARLAALQAMASSIYDRWLLNLRR